MEQEGAELARGQLAIADLACTKGLAALVAPAGRDDPTVLDPARTRQVAPRHVQRAGVSACDLRGCVRGPTESGVPGPAHGRGRVGRWIIASDAGDIRRLTRT